MYLDVSSIYIKQSEDLYVVNGLCAASLKKVDRWVIFCLKKIHVKFILDIVSVQQVQLGHVPMDSL